jgi:hypothetical protein
MILKPYRFFAHTPFDGDVRTSIRTIALFSLATAFVSLWTWKTAHPLLLVAYPMMAIFFSACFASLLSGMKESLGIYASFEEILRFFAYYHMLCFPLTILTIGNYRIASLVNLFAILWAVAGFAVAFRPRGRAFFAMAGVIAFVCSVATIGTFAAYETSLLASLSMKAEAARKVAFHGIRENSSQNR